MSGVIAFVEFSEHGAFQVGEIEWYRRHFRSDWTQPQDEEGEYPQVEDGTDIFFVSGKRIQVKESYERVQTDIRAAVWEEYCRFQAAAK